MIPQNVPDAEPSLELLSPAEFAAASGFSMATVRRLLSAGRLPKLQPGGARHRIAIPAAALATVRLGQSATPRLDHSAVAHHVQTAPRKRSGPLPAWRQPLTHNPREL